MEGSDRSSRYSTSAAHSSPVVPQRLRLRGSHQGLSSEPRIQADAQGSHGTSQATASRLHRQPSLRQAIPARSTYPMSRRRSRLSHNVFVSTESVRRQTGPTATRAGTIRSRTRARVTPHSGAKRVCHVLRPSTQACRSTLSTKSSGERVPHASPAPRGIPRVIHHETSEFPETRHVTKQSSSANTAPAAYQRRRRPDLRPFSHSPVTCSTRHSTSLRRPRKGCDARPTG